MAEGEGSTTTYGGEELDLDLIGQVSTYVPTVALGGIHGASRECRKIADMVAERRLSEVERRLAEATSTSAWATASRRARIGPRAVAEASLRVYSKMDADERQRRWRTLRHAVREDDAGAVFECVATGADLNARFAASLPAAHQAAMDGRSTALAALMDCGARVDVHADGFLPLCLAASYGRFDAAKTILDRAPEAVDFQDGFGVAPIVAAALVGEFELCTLLLDRNADITIPTFLGLTALDHAKRRGHSRVVAALIEHQRTTTNSSSRTSSSYRQLGVNNRACSTPPRADDVW